MDRPKGEFCQPEQPKYQSFTFDPIYRLISATGREHDIASPDFPWVDIVKTQDVTLTRGYTETYRYDPLGNMEQLRHVANGGGFTRNFTTDADSNRLTTMTIGADDFDYTYDASARNHVTSFRVGS